MADFYVDHGVYATVLGTTPTWGIPQEGDGSSKDAAPSASIATIKLNAQPSTGNLLSICGVNFGAGSGGTVNYTIGGTVSATADNIINAINGASTTVSTSVAVGTPQIRNLMFARKSGSDTVEVMMRIGSDKLNYATNAAVGIASSGWAAAPTITNFSGGVGGAWGYFYMATAFGVSNSIAAHTYGGFIFKPYVSAPALPTNQEFIFVRTGGAAGKFVAANSVSGGATIYKSPGYTPNLVFDTNTVWTGDDPNGVFELTLNCINWGSQTALSMGTSAAGNGPNEGVTIRCLRQGNFLIRQVNTQSGGSWAITTNFQGAYFHAEGLEVVDEYTYNAPNSSLVIWKKNSAAGASVMFKNCTFRNTVPKTELPWFSIAPDYNAPGLRSFDGCVFDIKLIGVGDPGTILVNNNSVFDMNAHWRFRDCSFLGYEPGYDPYRGTYPSPTNGSFNTIEFENCHGIKFPASYWGLSTATTLNGVSPMKQLMIRAPDGQFRLETDQGITEWIEGASPAFPTLGAMLEDGATPWSLRVQCVNGYLTPTKAMQLPVLKTLNRLATASRTLTVNILVPTAVTSPGLRLSCVISYIDETGAIRVHSPALSASTAAWAGMSSWPNHSKYKFEVVTPYQVKGLTEVSASVYVCTGLGTGSNEYLFVDPLVAVV